MHLLREQVDVSWKTALELGKRLKMMRALFEAAKDLRDSRGEDHQERVARLATLFMAVEQVEKSCPACTWGELPHKKCNQYNKK